MYGEEDEYNEQDEYDLSYFGLGQPQKQKAPFLMNGTVKPTGEGFRTYNNPGVPKILIKRSAPDWRDKAKFGLGALDTLNSLWGSYQARQAFKLAKQQFAFQKEIGNANLNNQIKSYNTTLEDRARNRAQFSAAEDGTGQDYIDANKLSR